MNYKYNNDTGAAPNIQKTHADKNPKQSEEITIDGVTYSSFRAACRAYGRDHSTALSRVSAGMSKEDAIKKEFGREFSYEGKVFNGAKACCEYYDVAYRNVDYYAKAHKISMQEAITIYRNKKK